MVYSCCYYYYYYYYYYFYFYFYFYFYYYYYYYYYYYNDIHPADEAAHVSSRTSPGCGP